jgi:hypothetical protein
MKIRCRSYATNYYFHFENFENENYLDLKMFLRQVQDEKFCLGTNAIGR